jgi:hypothetical protein
MGTLEQDGNQFIKSEEPADNGYGQNGYRGPSSDLPGKRTTSGFLPKATAPINAQMRKIDASPIAVHPGMAPRKSAGTIPSNGRPVTTRK